MTHFDCVIEHGTVDDLKDCILAVVYLPPAPCQRRLSGTWYVEIDHDLRAFYYRGAEHVMAEALRDCN